MIEDLLKNLKLEPLESWGPEPLQRNQLKDIPIGFYHRFEKISSCDLNSFLQKKAYEDQDNFITINTADKKISKNPNNIVKNKLYIQKRSETRNQPIYKHYSQKWTKNFVKAKQAAKTKFKESLTIKNGWIQLPDIRPSFDIEYTGKVNIQCFKEVGILKALNPIVQNVSRKEHKLDFQQLPVNSNFTQNDRVLRSLALKYYTNNPQKKTVILLPQFLTAIMTMKFSQYPWHIYVNKTGNLITLNSYDEVQNITYLDLYAVNENTQNNMPEQSTIFDNCVMATRVTKSFKQQLASGKIIQQVEYVSQNEGEEEDQEQQQQEEEDEQSFKKYVKIQFDDTDFYTFSEVDGAKTVINTMTQEQQTKYYLARSLIEIETNYQWKKKFEKTAAGDVISGQYLANNVNWQKWLIEAFLAQAEHFKIAYISENKDSVFNILNVMELKAKSINENLRFNIKRCWNVLKNVVDSLFQGADGNFILMKSAYSFNLKVYEIPKADQEEQNEEQ